MNFKNLRTFRSIIQRDSERYIVELSETLGEREKTMIGNSASKEFLENILIFKDDYDYYLFKPTYHLYFFEKFNDLLNCIKDFYNIHKTNRNQIVADKDTQKRIMEYLKSNDMNIFSCMNLAMDTDPSYFTERLFRLNRWDQSLLDPKKFNIPYIKTRRRLIEDKEDYAPFHYKGYDWLLTSHGGFWLVGYSYPKNEVSKQEYNKMNELYRELVLLAFETDDSVMYTCIDGIFDSR
jgi:hypothetical protein